MWTATRTMLAIQTAHPLFRWPVIVLAYLYSAILPVFYFALSREEGMPLLPNRLRWVSFAGALAGVAVVVAGPPLTTMKTLFSDVATLACILLLMAFFRQGTDASPTDAHVGGWLRLFARVAVIAGGIGFAFYLLAGVIAISNYSQAMARTKTDIVTGAIRTLLELVCLFTAPFAVYRYTLLKEKR
jgi:hypothetical protein